MASKEKMVEALSDETVSVGMSDWENQFVASVQGFSNPSSKQLNKLTDLYIKYIPPGRRE